MRPGFTVFFVLFISAALAHGEEDRPPPYSGKIGISYAATSGNTQTTYFALSSNIVARRSTYTFSVAASYTLNRTSSITTSEETNSTIRIERVAHEPLSAYAQATYYRDPFSGILRQYILDGGISWQAVKRSNLEVKLGQGVAPTWEQYITSINRSFIGTKTSIGLKLRFSETLELSQGESYTHDFSDVSNWRFDSSCDVSVAIYRQIIKFHITRADRVRGKPDIGKQHADSSTTVGFTIQLPRSKPKKP